VQNNGPNPIAGSGSIWWSPRDLSPSGSSPSETLTLLVTVRPTGWHGASWSPSIGVIPQAAIRTAPTQRGGLGGARAHRDQPERLRPRVAAAGDPGRSVSRGDRFLWRVEGHDPARNQLTVSVSGSYDCDPEVPLLVIEGRVRTSSRSTRAARVAFCARSVASCAGHDDHRWCRAAGRRDPQPGLQPQTEGV